MGCIVRRAELRGPPAGEALGLIAAGKERKFGWISVAGFGEPERCCAQRLLPFNFAELA